MRRLIEEMAAANPLWRAPRIPGELKMLGMRLANSGWRFRRRLGRHRSHIDKRRLILFVSPGRELTCGLT